MDIFIKAQAGTQSLLVKVDMVWVDARCDADENYVVKGASISNGNDDGYIILGKYSDIHPARAQVDKITTLVRAACHPGNIVFPTGVLYDMEDYR